MMWPLLEMVAMPPVYYTFDGHCARMGVQKNVGRTMQAVPYEQEP